jgi:hypothetical protein
MDDTLKARGRELEDEFFARQDAVLIAKLRELEQMEHTQKALSEVSGISNPHILKRLVELDIHPELLASLAVLPLVEVAWADGEVHAKERDAILRSVTSTGFSRGSVDYALLEEWLKQRPPPRLLEAWVHYVQGLSAQLTDKERTEFRNDLLARARTVAEAAGGFLGLTSRVSSEERAIIARMEAAFDGNGAA